MRPYRVGMIVPSSNVTMETEVPELLRRRTAYGGESFTVHSSRVRMQHVTPEELAAMNTQAGRAATELADARPDAVAYACLVAAMAEGPGTHTRVERDLSDGLAAAGVASPITSSAGALIDGIKALSATRIALVAPYLPALTQRVIDYLESSGITVVDSISLSVSDNLEVAALDPEELPAIASKLDTSAADAVVLSACVQMPSLQAVDRAEQELGLPVLTAATATAWRILTLLGVEAAVPQAGRLLSPATS
jgi:maleate isomerase